MILRSDLIGPIAWSVVRVPPGRPAAWQALTGWTAHHRAVGDRLARMLDADISELPMTVLSPPAGVGGLLLIEAVGTIAPLRSLGWAAAELSVADLAAVATRAAQHGFTLIGPPRALGSTASIAACQIVDPGGAAIYCADVRAYAGKADLTRAVEPVDRMFIAILATNDLAASRAWYAQRFGVTPISDHAVPIPVLSSAWQVDPATPWRISSQQLAGGCLVEIDQYPPDAPPRARDTRGLAGGVAAVAFVAGTDAVMTGPSGERLFLVRDCAVP